MEIAAFFFMVQMLIGGIAIIFASLSLLLKPTGKLKNKILIFISLVIAMSSIVLLLVFITLIGTGGVAGFRDVIVVFAPTVVSTVLCGTVVFRSIKSLEKFNE